MNIDNSTAIRITRRDFRRLPKEMRRISNTGPVVATTRKGERVFVAAVIVS